MVRGCYRGDCRQFWSLVTQAQYNLAVMYADGVGVPKNDVETPEDISKAQRLAAEWLEQHQVELGWCPRARGRPNDKSLSGDKNGAQVGDN